MTIDSADELISAMGNNSSRLVLSKSNITNATTGQFHSLWQATGQPGAGATPTAVAVPDIDTVGAIRFSQQIAPATSYIGLLEANCTNSGTTLEIHDRICHMGGLNGTVTTAQTVNMDLSTLLATNNLDARKGDANYSDVQWWLEWYSPTGATVVNATVNVTYDDGTTGNLTVVSLAATRRAAFMQPLNYLIPAGAAGKYIRGVNNVTLSATTGTVGNFGVTATRYRAANFLPVANARFTADWAALGLPEVVNDSCLFAIQIANSSSTGIVNATGKIVHG